MGMRGMVCSSVRRSASEGATFRSSVQREMAAGKPLGRTVIH